MTTRLPGKHSVPSQRSLVGCAVCELRRNHYAATQSCTSISHGYGVNHAAAGESLRPHTHSAPASRPQQRRSGPATATRQHQRMPPRSEVATIGCERNGNRCVAWNPQAPGATRVTSKATGSRIEIRHAHLGSYGYRLPRRGNTIDQETTKATAPRRRRCSKFWKSNPYLDQHSLMRQLTSSAVGVID